MTEFSGLVGQPSLKLNTYLVSDTTGQSWAPPPHAPPPSFSLSLHLFYMYTNMQSARLHRTGRIYALCRHTAL